MKNISRKDLVPNMIKMKTKSKRKRKRNNQVNNPFGIGGKKIKRSKNQRKLRNK
jgi:hypothetical protein